MFFLLPFERNVCQNWNKTNIFLWNHNAKARVETLRIQILFFDFFYKLITFNIPTNDWISIPAFGGTGVFISGIVNPIINSVKFSFWVSVYSLPCITLYIRLLVKINRYSWIINNILKYNQLVTTCTLILRSNYSTCLFLSSLFLFLMFLFMFEHCLRCKFKK